jgi:hypothetical protein
MGLRRSDILVTIAIAKKEEEKKKKKKVELN